MAAKSPVSLVHQAGLGELARAAGLNLKRLWHSSLVGVLIVVLVPGSERSNAQQGGPLSRSFSFSNRARVNLASDWTARSDRGLPPLPLLAASSPRLVFSDFLSLENRRAPAVLQLGVSDNPFFGSNAVELDTRVHELMVRDLFYFFFPPPRSCLVRAKASFEAARRNDEERLRKEESEREEKHKQRAATRQPTILSQACEFSPTPSDFYAAELSQGIMFRETDGGDRVEGRLRNFYLPPMEELEIGGNTFFIFEARAERTIEPSDIQAFGLPDESRGERAHFFWAIGARTPFPFVRDPQRKDLELVHVVYASLSLDGNARAEFRDLLDRVAF